MWKKLRIDPLILIIVLVGILSCGGVPQCSEVSDTCTADTDCSGVDNVVCRAVGPPDDPGPKNCLCKDGWYGNPQENCFERSFNAPIFGMYRGCFKVDKNDRVITRAAGDYRFYKMNTYDCRETCSAQDTAFAVLQEGDVCFCADDISGLGVAVDDEKCNSNCTDEDPEGRKCGGFEDLEDGVVTESYSSIYTTQKGVSSLWFVDLVKDLFTMIPARARVDLVPPPGFCKPLMNFQFDWGNGAGFSYPHRNTWMDWVYAVPGSYILSAKADERFSRMDATQVTVREQVRREGLEVRCGEYYRFGMRSNCSVSAILGTGLKVNIYWGDRDRKVFDYSRIEDPFHCVAGNPVVQKINCADYGASGYRPESEYMYSASGLVVDPLAQFNCEGVLKGFEYFATAESGSAALSFLLYAPQCGSGLKWCYETMQCLPEVEECLAPFSHECNGSFCQLGMGCSDNMCVPRNRTDALGLVTFQAVPDASWTVPVETSCGSECGCHGVFNLDLGTVGDLNHFRVYPGYLLVVQPVDAKLYYTVDPDSTDPVYDITPGNTFQLNLANIIGTGFKPHYRGFLAEESSINLTNTLPTPYLDLSYDVEIWVTADSFGDDADQNITDILDGVSSTFPVYHFQFQVFVHEGFDNVIITPMYEFHPYAEALAPYEFMVDIDNPAAYFFDVQLSITWGDGSPVDPPELILKPTRLQHTFAVVGQYEVCVHLENKVSHDTECWNVTALNPVLPKYDVVFSNTAIGCACGDTPYLGDGDGYIDVTILIPEAERTHFENNFPTEASAFIEWDSFSNDEQVEPLVDTHTPENPLALSHTYANSGCRNVTLTMSNFISSIQYRKQVCVYERIANVLVEKVELIHRGQIAAQNPMVELPRLKICDYGSATDCFSYLNKNYYIRITMNQTSKAVNQTYKWHWNDESEHAEETILASNVASHLFQFSTYGLSNYVVLSNMNVRISNPLQDEESGVDAAVVTYIRDGDGDSYRIALVPSTPEVMSVSSVWKPEDTVEVTFNLVDIGWKSCCFTYCEGCDEPLAFLQSFYDSDDLVTGDPDPRGNLLNGYNRCNNQNDVNNSWHDETASLYLINNQRLDTPDGIDWEGWEGDIEKGQINLPSRVIRENVIRVKKIFGADQKSYKLHYYCWNPLGSSSAVYEFARKEPIKCGFPLISIDYRGAEVFSPLEVYRKDRNFLTGNVILNCDDTLRNTKWWECEVHSEATGRKSGESFVPPFPGNNTAELVIPPRGLHFQVYKCTLTVRMDTDYSSPLYQNSAFTYIKIMPYKLLGQMYYSLTNLDLGLRQEVILNPGLYSKDYDIEGGAFVDFQWFSRCGSEQYPLNYAGDLITDYPPPLPKGKQAGLAGGVEGLGPGRISDALEGELRLTPILFGGMRAGLTCEFMALFKKRPDPFDRQGKAMVTVNVFENVIPTVKIVSGNGTKAEPTITPDQRPAQKINPIGSFRALSECTGDTNCDEVLFEWNLVCLKVGLVEPIDYVDDNNYENVTFTTEPELQPVQSLRVDNSLKDIGFPMALLAYQIQNNVTDCILKLKLCQKRSQTQITQGLPANCGKASMNLRLNQPPTGGTVTMVHKPLEKYGNCLENYMYWNFSFPDWVDPDDNCIKSFKIMQISGEDMLRVPLNQELVSLAEYNVQTTSLYKGPQNPYNEKLKFGRAQHDWAVVVCVKITDCYGAYTIYCIQDSFEKVPLSEMSTCSQETTPNPGVTSNSTKYGSKVRELLGDDPFKIEQESMAAQQLIAEALVSNYSKYIAEQSNRNLTAFALIMVEMLNEIADGLEEQLETIEQEMSLYGSQLDEEIGSENVTKLEQIMKTKESLRASIAESSEGIKEELLLGLKNGVMDLNTADTIESVAGVVSDSSKKPKEMSERAMASAKDISKNIATNLLEQAPDLDQATLESITQVSLGGLANIMMGARSKVLDGKITNNDTVQTATMPQYFGDPIEGSPEELGGKITEWGFELFDNVDSISAACQMNKAAEEPDTNVAAENIGMQLTKKQLQYITGTHGTILSVQSTTMVQAPKTYMPNFDYLLDGTQNWSPRKAVSLQNMAMNEPALFGVPGDYLINGSTLVRIVFSDDETGAAIQIPEARKSIDLHIPKERSEAMLHNYRIERGWLQLGPDTQFFLQQVEIEGDVALSIYAKYIDQLVDEWLCVYVRRGKEPLHDPVKNTWEYDFFQILPRDLSRGEMRRHQGERYPDKFVYHIENHLLADSGTYWIGIRPCRKNFDENYFVEEIISNKVFGSDFEFNFWTQSCLTMSEKDPENPEATKDFKTKGCVVGSLSNEYLTECMCMHLTSFAGSLAPAPPALDFSKMSYNWEDMYPVYSVLIGLWIVYLILMLWARRQDRIDIAKLGFTPLPDNNPGDFYMYEMAVQTGMLKGAGTRSQVYFYLVGELGRSRVHVLEDPYRGILNRNAKDLFLLSTPRSLGKLVSVRLWHDCSGSGQKQNWFCDYVAFRDVQTGEKTFFMAYRWWSLVNDDGVIDRTLSRTEPENMKQFRFMFASKTREKLNDGHLYYSIFARPVESNFTRCQRCSSAMCILLLEFCVSAIYYQTRQSVDESTTVWVGPLKFNVAELGVSLMATLFVLPLSLLVVQMFRRTKPFMTPEEEELDDLDAEEEILNARRLKRREEEKEKREERKKRELAKYLRAAGLTVEPRQRRPSTDSQAGLTGNMERQSSSVQGSQSSSLEHSGSLPAEGSPKHPGINSASGHKAKKVQINDQSQSTSSGKQRQLMVGGDLGVINPEDLGDLSISESSESEYETDEDDLDLDCYDRIRRSKWFCCIQCFFDWGEKRQRRKRQPLMLPSSFLYIAWLLVMVILVGCTAVITMYAAMIAFQGGSALVGKWVISMIGSIFMSIFLVQPLKILILAMIISALCQTRSRRKENPADLEEFDGLNEEELLLLSKLENSYEKDKHLYSGEQVGDLIVGKLPDEEYLDEDSYWAKKASARQLLPGELTVPRKRFLRTMRNKELAMMGVVREIVLYLIFVWLLFSVCYIEKDATGFYLYEEIKNVLVYDSFDQVYDIDGYWDYLIDHFVPNMYSMQWYNGQKPIGLYQYFGDKINLVVGYSVIRQIRVRKDLCEPYKIGRYNISRECIPPFSAEYEDRGRYGPRWTKFDANNPYHILRQEYRYVDSEEIDGYPFWGQSATYPGGGFLVRLNGNMEDSLKKIKALKSEKFVDHYTRAMMHEFTIYNPTYNLFAVVTMIAEVVASAGVFPYYYCDPLRLIMYHGPTGPYQIAVQIGLALFLIGFIFRDGRKIYKQRAEFFKQSWNVVDFVVDILGFVAIVFFLYRYTETKNAMARVSLVGGREYVNLNYLVTLSLVYLVMIACICFAATIRFLKILNFNKKISMFRDVLITCRTDLASFGVMFLVLQAGFVTMAYMFFGNFLLNYNTLFQTQQSLFNMLLGKFSFEELISIDETLGAIFFMSYSNCMMLITLNIFVVILDASVGDVNEGLAEKSNEYEILAYFGSRVRNWAKYSFGSAKKTVTDLKHRKEIENRRALDSKIEDLPHKFNHLVDIINDRYFDGQEVFNIQVSDYTDIRLLEKARKRAPKGMKGDADGDDSDQEESSDDEIYEHMTADFNTLIPNPSSRAVSSKKPQF